MTDISKLQERVFQNKKNHGFNTTKVEPELLLITEELGEVIKASRNGNKEELVEEIADVIIVCLGLLKILKIDAGKAVLAKVQKNEKRKYKKKGKWHIDINKSS